MLPVQAGTAQLPGYARVDPTRYELGAGAAMHRTRFDDGAVRQAPLYRTSPTTRSLSIELPGDRVTAFQAWAAGVGAGHFAVKDPFDRTIRAVRIVGGAGAIRYRQSARRAGWPWWTAEMQADDANLARDLWDPLLPLGDASHVYLRQSGPLARSDLHASGRKIVWFALPAPSVRLPDAWAVAPPAFFREVLWERMDDGASRSSNYKVRLASTVDGRGVLAGPDLKPAVLDGVAQVARFRNTSLAVVGLTDNTDPAAEPYHGLFDVAAMNAFLDPVIAAITDTSKPTLDYALVWAGPHSVVDLERLRATPIGAAPAV